VDSRPDALLLKARIAIQNQPSGRQSAIVRMRVHLIWKLRIQFQPSGRLPIMVRTRATQIWKLRVEDQPSGRPSSLVRMRESLIWKLLAVDMRPSGRQCLTVRKRLSNRKDFQLKYHKFWSHSCPSGWLRFTVRTASVHNTVVAHLNPQPINRGPWALRIARIRY
jgi:hypothetical protein